MKTLLLTGFEPFGGDTTNASWEAVSQLPDTLGDFTLIKRQIPVVYDGVSKILQQLIEENRPDAVICVGQAANRCAVTPEKVAINWKAGRIADNEGVLYRGERIYADSPDAYFSTLPVEKMVESMQKVGAPAQVSYTAGTYVCNSTLYALLHYTKRTCPQIQGCFIHVPYLCSQVLEHPNAPSLPLETVVAALSAGISCLSESST